MKGQSILSCLAFALSVLGVSPLPAARAAQANLPIIVSPREASWMEQLAAREVRRYVYLRTGRCCQSWPSRKGRCLEATSFWSPARTGRSCGPSRMRKCASFGSLAPQSYRLNVPSPTAAGHPPPAPGVLLVTGGDDAGTLYAAYRLAETLGVRFYLHGDVIPDEPMKWKLPESGRARGAAVRTARHPAVPRLSGRAGLVEPRRLPGGDWAVAEAAHELLRAAHLPRGAPECGAHGLDWAAGRHRRAGQGQVQLPVQLHEHAARQLGLCARENQRLRVRQRGAVRA